MLYCRRNVQKWESVLKRVKKAQLKNCSLESGLKETVLEAQSQYLPPISRVWKRMKESQYSNGDCWGQESIIQKAEIMPKIHSKNSKGPVAMAD